MNDPTTDRWRAQADAAEARLRQQLLAGRAGDNAAYAEFLRGTAALLRGYFRRRLIIPADDVEDLVQETLLAVHAHSHTYQSRQPITAWMRGIARYKLVDLLRARARWNTVDRYCEDRLSVGAVQDVEVLEQQHDAAVLLRMLPDRQRQAVRMVTMDGATVAEAATATGWSRRVVRACVRSGLRQLALRCQVRR